MLNYILTTFKSYSWDNQLAVVCVGVLAVTVTIINYGV